jgi:hypothetical protein
MSEIRIYATVLALLGAACGTGGSSEDEVEVLADPEPCVPPTVCEPDAGADLDAAASHPDAGPGARGYFDYYVKPIVMARCDSCHVGGADGAPIFPGDYDTYTTYSGARGALTHCTLTQSLLFTEGEHAAGHGLGFDPAELARVREFLGLEAAERPSCQPYLGRLPSTGSLPVQLGNYTLDLSVLGTGLFPGRVSFTMEQGDGGMVLSDLAITAGGAGLVVVGVNFELCPAGVAESTSDFRALREDLPAGRTVLVGDGFLFLPGVAIGERFALRFDALLPMDGALGAPLDHGGACIIPG